MKKQKELVPPRLCECGCGNYLPPRSVRTGPFTVRFIKGHASKLRPLRANYAKKKTHKCTCCGKRKPLKEFTMQKWISAKGISVWYPARCRECHKAKGKRVHGDLKRRVYDQYGNKCNSCGITDHRVLQLDHVNGGGRKEYMKWSHTVIYRRALKFPGEYQILCANCNWIKKYETAKEGSGRPIKDFSKYAGHEALVKQTLVTIN